MPTYGSRISELRDLLTQAATGVDERVVREHSQFIDKYGEMRQRALDDLVDYIAKASVGNLGTQAKWESRIKTVRADYNKLYGEVTDRVLPPSLQLFWFATIDAEEKFFEPLSKVKTPQLFDDLLKHQDGLSKLIAELQDGWKFLLSSDTGLENDQMYAIRQVDEMVQGIVSDMDAWHHALVDNAARASEAARKKAEEIKTQAKEKLGAAGEVIETVLAFLKKLILDAIKPDGLQGDFDTQLEAAGRQMGLSGQALVDRVRLYRSLVQRYQSLVNIEKGGVLTMFKKTRDEVDVYVKTNDISHASQWLDQARGQLTDWVSALPRARQQDDAGSFRAEIHRHIDDDWRITEDLDRKFRGQYQGLFLSPISNETVETLAEKYLFEQHLKAIDGRGGAAKLGQHRSRLAEFAESMDRALDPLEDVVASVPPEVQELARLRNKEFRAYVRERIKRQVEALLRSIEDLQRMLEPSAMANDFSREELERMLR